MNGNNTETRDELTTENNYHAIDAVPALAEGDRVTVEYESVHGKAGNRQHVALTITDTSYSTVAYAADDDGHEYRIETEGEIKKCDKYGNPRCIGVIHSGGILLTNPDESETDDEADEDESEELWTDDFEAGDRLRAVLENGDTMELTADAQTHSGNVDRLEGDDGTRYKLTFDSLLTVGGTHVGTVTHFERVDETDDDDDDAADYSEGDDVRFALSEGTPKSHRGEVVGTRHKMNGDVHYFVRDENGGTYVRSSDSLERFDGVDAETFEDEIVDSGRVVVSDTHNAAGKLAKLLGGDECPAKSPDAWALEFADGRRVLGTGFRYYDADEWGEQLPESVVTLVADGDDESTEYDAESVTRAAWLGESDE